MSHDYRNLNHNVSCTICQKKEREREITLRLAKKDIDIYNEYY